MLTVFIIIAALEFIGLVYLGETALRRGPDRRNPGAARRPAGTSSSPPASFMSSSSRRPQATCLQAARRRRPGIDLQAASALTTA